MSNTILLKTDNICMSIDSTLPGRERVQLAGKLVIQHAHAIKSGLLTALNRSQHLTIVLTNILKLDVAVLQLLLALQKSAVLQDKTIAFEIQITDYMRSVHACSGIELTPCTNVETL
jgi:hypothetical protein